ncbi:MAG: hypothetical protein K8R55_07325 [Desulfuromonadaceae bacterium]|nr:hypothetical protein [Desulfuromonadaceae bacterium]
MAKQKFRPARRRGFSGVKAYMEYVEVLKKHCNAVGRTLYHAMQHNTPIDLQPVLRLYRSYQPTLASLFGIGIYQHDIFFTNLLPANDH